VDEKEFQRALRLARVAVQDHPAFSIIDAKHGYSRSPTEEEKLLSKALLSLKDLRG
jgi:hypothetical protein